MKKVLFFTSLFFFATIAQAQSVEYFDQANVCSGQLPCWNIQPSQSGTGSGGGGNDGGGSGGNSKPTVIPGTSLCDSSSGFDISTALPIEGSGSLHTYFHSAVDSSSLPYGSFQGNSYTIYSPTIATDGDSVSIQFRINAAAFHDTTSSIAISFTCGNAIMNQYNYTQADSGVVHTISQLITGSGGGGPLGINIVYGLTTHPYVSDSLIFDLYLDNFYTTGPLDSQNACASMVLPLTLLSFTGNNLNCTNELSWETSNEKNFSHFEVQRSGDGQQFNTIGTVGSTTKECVFNDKNPSGSASYYRLKMMNINGTYTYSPVIKVTGHCYEAQQIQISPNPAHEILTVTGLSGKARITLIDALGRQLMVTDSYGKTQQIDMARFATGIYMIRIIDEEGVTTNFRLTKN